MNQKQAKRLRRNTQRAIDDALNAGVRSSVDTDTHIKKRSYDRFLVPSNRYNATVTNADGTTETHNDHAINVRLTIGSPRQVYRQVKRRVQSNRNKKRSRVLPSLQLRPTEAPGAVEYTGAAGVQRQHSDVRVL